MDTEVIVVGAGPSGLTVASELAQAGVKTVIFERRTGHVESRAGTLLPRVLEHFDTRGVVDRFIRKGLSLQPWPFTPGHIWAGMKPVEWKHYQSRFDFTLIVPQNDTEVVMLDWCRELGVDVRTGIHITNVGETDDGVFVEYEEGGESKRATAKYLVGADGGRSVVRTKMGIPFEGTEATLIGTLGDSTIKFPFEGTMKSVDSPKGWALALHFGENQTRIGYVHVDNDPADKDKPVTLEEYTKCLRDIFGTDFGIDELTWSSRFTDTIKLVPDFGKGRVFLVGEACRIHYPSSGVGMNFCIQDGYNLGWKLAYVVKGKAPASILKTYNEERRPVAEKLLEGVYEQCKVQFDFSKGGLLHREHFERDLLPLTDLNHRLGLELNGTTMAYPAGPNPHRLAGWRAFDADLILRDGSMTRLGEQLRSMDFVLLDLSGTAAFSGLRLGGAPVKVVEAQGVRLPNELHGVKAMLIRPDAYVAWATDEAPTEAAAMSALRQWVKVDELVPA